MKRQRLIKGYTVVVQEGLNQFNYAEVYCSMVQNYSIAKTTKPVELRGIKLSWNNKGQQL